MQSMFATAAIDNATINSTTHDDASITASSATTITTTPITSFGLDVHSVKANCNVSATCAGPYHVWPGTRFWPTHRSSIEISVLLLHGTKQYLLEAVLAISSVSLVASLIVYAIVPKLRTVPGKCLMGLIVSMLLSNIFVIAAFHSRSSLIGCFVVGVGIHYSFLTIVSWTSIIAFDIMKKLRYPNQKLHHFVRYIFFVYLIPMVVVTIALIIEFLPQTAKSPFRPRYGRHICGISAPMAKLLFFTLPINVSLLINIIIFSLAIYKIKQVVREIAHSHISSSIRKRCLWYAKLSLMLGISTVFGYFGIQLPCCETLKFTTTIIHAMHGLLIFIAFTCKRSTIKLLAKSNIFPICCVPHHHNAVSESVGGGATANSIKILTKKCATKSEIDQNLASSVRDLHRVHITDGQMLGTAKNEIKFDIRYATNSTLASINSVLESPRKVQAAVWSEHGGRKKMVTILASDIYGDVYEDKMQDKNRSRHNCARNCIDDRNSIAEKEEEKEEEEEEENKTKVQYTLTEN